MCTNPVQLIGSERHFKCGKCMECCTAYSNMWAQRCMDEAKLHKQNFMLTLTYKKTDGDLHKDDLQRFLKRLRRRIEPQKIRYFACGEYGGNGNAECPNGRPHYHLIVFGWFPPDAQYITTKKGVDYYGSKYLEEVWRIDEEARKNGREGGFISITDINYKACRYCAKYLQKLDERPHKVMPFTVMSRKPGIGAQSVNPDMLVNGLMYCEGKALPIPKFYVDKLEQMGYNVDVLKARRQYVYDNKIDSFTNETAVDSARKRGKYQSKILNRMG